MLPDDVVELIQYVDNNIWEFLYDLIRGILYALFKLLYWLYTQINTAYEYILKLNPINLILNSGVFDIYSVFAILLLIVFSIALIYGMVVSKKDEIKDVMKNAIIAIFLLFIIPSFIFNVNKTAVNFYKVLSSETVASVDNIFKNQFYDTEKSIKAKKPVNISDEEMVMWLDINKKSTTITEYYPSKKLINNKEVWQKETISSGWNLLGNGKVYAISANLVQIDMQLFFMVLISMVLVIQFILGLYDLSFSSIGVGAVIAYDTKGQQTKDVLNRFFGAMILLGLVLTMLSFTNLFSFNIINGDYPIFFKILAMIALALLVIQGSSILGSSLGSSTGAGRSFSALAGSAILGGKIASATRKAGRNLIGAGSKLAKGGFSKGQQAYKQAQKTYTGYQAKQEYNNKLKDRNNKVGSMSNPNKNFANSIGKLMWRSTNERNSGFVNGLTEQVYDGQIKDMNGNVLNIPKENNPLNNLQNTPTPPPFNVRSTNSRTEIIDNLKSSYSDKNQNLKIKK